MSRLLGVFAAELQEMRTTVMELRSPVCTVKTDGEDCPSDSGFSRRSSLIM